MLADIINVVEDRSKNSDVGARMIEVWLNKEKIRKSWILKSTVYVVGQTVTWNSIIDRDCRSQFLVVRWEHNIWFHIGVNETDTSNPLIISIIDIIIIVDVFFCHNNKID